MLFTIFRNFLFTFAISLLALNCSDGKAADKDRDAAIRSYLVVALSSASPTATSTGGKFPIPTCEVAAPTFSTLKTAGFESTCGRSGCHDGTTAYNATNFTQVKGLTASGTPTSSTLYNKQSTGSMAIYTTQAIDKAIYCWIKGGSNP